MIRSSQVLAGSTWPVSDEEGINGDFFMLLGLNNTFIMYGPKTNNTWIGVAKSTFINQQAPPVLYLQYLGDRLGSATVSLPTNGTGVNGQLCLLLDVNNTCVGVGLNTNGVWSILASAFLPSVVILSNGGNPDSPFGGG